MHQFCRIGRHAFIGPYSVIKQDVMPYSLTSQRAGARACSAPTASAWSGAASTRRAIEALQTAFRLLTRAGLNTTQAIERIRAEVPPCAEVDELLEFIRASERGVIK